MTQILVKHSRIYKSSQKQGSAGLFSLFLKFFFLFFPPLLLKKKKKEKGFLLILNLSEHVSFVHSLFVKENSRLRPWLTLDRELWSTMLKDGNFYKTIMTCKLAELIEEGKLQSFIFFNYLTTSPGLQNGKHCMYAHQMHGGLSFFNTFSITLCH